MCANLEKALIQARPRPGHRERERGISDLNESLGSRQLVNANLSTTPVRTRNSATPLLNTPEVSQTSTCPLGAGELSVLPILWPHLRSSGTHRLPLSCLDGRWRAMHNSLPAPLPYSISPAGSPPPSPSHPPCSLPMLTATASAQGPRFSPRLL